MLIAAPDDTAELRRLCEDYYARSVSGRKMLVRDMKAWDRARSRVAELTGEIFTGKRWEPIVQSYTETQPPRQPPERRYTLIPEVKFGEYFDPRDAHFLKLHRARLIVNGEMIHLGEFSTRQARDEAVDNAKIRLTLGLPIKGA